MRAWRPSLLALVTIASLEPAIVAAQSADRITVPLSNPQAPVMLRCSLLSGSIIVTAYDGHEVVIEPRLAAEDEDAATRREEAEERRREREEARREREAERRRDRTRGDEAADTSEPIDRAAGLQRVRNFSAGISVEEHDNEVTVSGPMHSRNVDLDIKVPMSATVHLATVNDGDIVVRNVRGEVEAQNTNGRVTLTRVTGPVVAHALNGDVVVSLAGPVPNRPTQLSSMNGDIDLTLPADAKVSVWIRADNGEIYTDFDLQMKSRSMPNDAGDDAKRKRKRDYGFQTGMHGTLNGGGVEIRLVTYNGDVYIRKAK